MTTPAAALAVALAVFVPLNPVFLSQTTLTSILRTAAFIGIVAVGQTMLLIGGDFDLSVGSVAALSATVAALTMHDHGWPVALGVLAGVLVGLLVGLVNGVLTVVVGLPAFIVTLGMLFAARSGAYIVSDGREIYPLPESLGALGDDVGGLPVSVWVFVLCIGIAELLLRRGSLGRRLYACGGNREAAWLAGIPVRWIRLRGFLLTGALAGAAGVLVMARLKSGDPQIGNGWELSVIAAVVVGGVSLTGGRGTVLGAALGVVFLQTVSAGLVTVGLKPTLQPIATGGAMVVALLLNSLRTSTRNAR